MKAVIEFLLKFLDPKLTKVLRSRNPLEHFAGAIRIADAVCESWRRIENGSFEIVTTTGITYRLGNGDLDEVEDLSGGLILLGRFLVPDSSDRTTISVEFKNADARAFMRAVYETRGLPFPVDEGW